MRFSRLFLPLLVCVPVRAAELHHRFYISAEEIRTLDTRTLGKLLVERIHRECDLAGAPASGEKVLGDDAEVIMMVPSRLLDAIARDGFLNQHQVHRTGGQSRESDRFEAEQELAMLRLPFGVKGRELLPKYAVLNIKKSGLGAYRLPTQYGNVAIVFKKEVAARATWTYADSLDYSQKSGRFDAGGANNPVLARTFLYERKKEDRNRCGNYCEAQIWGKLTLDDVAYAMVRDSEPVPGALARAGIPVYDYSVPGSTAEVVNDSGTAQYIRKGLRQLLPSPFRGMPSEPAVSGTVGVDHPIPMRDGDVTVPVNLLLTSDKQKNSEMVASFEKAFQSGDTQTRELALYALSELPWSKFKSRLLAGLDAVPGPLLISAIAFAAEHRDDPDVTARLERLRHAPESVATEWLERLDKNRLCGPL